MSKYNAYREVFFRSDEHGVVKLSVPVDDADIDTALKLPENNGALSLVGEIAEEETEKTVTKSRKNKAD